MTEQMQNICPDCGRLMKPLIRMADLKCRAWFCEYCQSRWEKVDDKTLKPIGEKE